MNKYIAPKLTKYGKIENIIQAGSVALQSGDLTGDGVADQAFDTNGDGKADVIVGGANDGQTPVTFIQNIIGQEGYSRGDGGNLGASADLYDSDGDGRADFAIADLNNSPTLQRINDSDADSVTLSDLGFLYDEYNISPFNTELSSAAPWDNPVRD